MVLLTCAMNKLVQLVATQKLPARLAYRYAFVDRS